MTTTDIQIAFPKVDQGSMALAIPAQANLPANTYVGQLVAADAGKPADARKVLSCSSLLQGETLEQAKREAAELLDQMLDNTQIFMAYGTQALKGVNDLIDRLLHEVEPTRIDELTGLMRELNAGMRGVQKKYDVSDPKVREKYENWKGGIGRFFGKAKTLYDMLMEDVRSIESQLDKVGKTMHGRQLELTRNVSYYDELYDENENEIVKVIYVIGVMELIRDLAVERAAAVVVGNAQLGDRGGEQRRRLAEFAENMNLKIAEYKGRLFVAWSTSPQVSTMRTLNVSVAERINELLCVTIPTMKATIVQWRMLIQTRDAAELSQGIIDANNSVLKAYYAAGAQIVPMVADMVETPSLSTETVAAMADSVATQVEGIIRAAEAGKERRAALDDAMITAKGILDDSSKKLTDAIINNVVSAATKPVELNVATSVYT